MKVLGKVLLAICFVSLTTSGFAQLSIGPRADINLATWSLDDEAQSEIGNGDPQTRLSLLFGAVAEIRINDNFAIQPEVNFIQKGVRFEESERDPILGDISVELDVLLNQIEIPIMLKGGVSFGAGRFDVLAGPSFSYSLNGRLKNTTTYAGETESESEDIDFEEDEIARTELGLQFGAAFSFNLGSTAKLFVDGRYLMGLTNLNTTEEAFEVKNRGIALSAGVLFPL
ncbi:MAG: PorT family protein [Lewinellaceae bacterium]|nr:PorT family protein [Lewinellaceae bacterium]